MQNPPPIRLGLQFMWDMINRTVCPCVVQPCIFIKHDNHGHCIGLDFDYAEEYTTARNKKPCLPVKFESLMFLVKEREEQPQLQ